MFRRLVTPLALSACTLLVAACGSDGSAPSAGSASAITDAVTTTAAPATTAAVTTTAAPATTLAPTTDAPTTTEPATLPPTTEAPTTLAPTTTVAAPTTATAVVVSPLGTLGWWDGSAWIDDDVVTPAIPYTPGESFTVFGIDSLTSTAVSGATRPDCEFFSTYTLDLTPALGYDPGTGASALAVNATWDVLLRSPAIMDPAAPTPEATAAVTGQLATLGVPGSPVRLTQLITVDLDGDGVDELLINAVHPAFDLAQPPQAGWYSTVLLQRTVGGTTTVEQLDGAAWPVAEPDFPSGVQFRISAVGDLNGDGRMEVVVSYQVWEGAGDLAYEMPPAGASTMVLATGCGA